MLNTTRDEFCQSNPVPPERGAAGPLFASPPPIAAQLEVPQAPLSKREVWNPLLLKWTGKGSSWLDGLR